MQKLIRYFEGNNTTISNSSSGKVSGNRIEIDRSSENNSGSVKFSLDKTDAQAVGSHSSNQPEKYK